MILATDNPNELTNGIEIMIHQRGFGLVHVHDHTPWTYTYTVGLMKSIGMEFVIAGKFSNTEYSNFLGFLVPKLSKRMKKHKPINSLTISGLMQRRVNNSLCDAKIRIQRVHQSHIDSGLFTQAQHRSTVPIIVMQIVIFDKNGNLPGDPDWHDEAMLQPDLTMK
jgi:Domain of unknown function (DUF4262)